MLGKEVFIEAYGNVEVPAPMDTRGSEDPEFIAKRDAFFKRIQASLDLSHLVLSETISIQGDVVSSSDVPRSLTIFQDLWFRDEQVLGSSLQRIGPGVKYSARFAKYPLNPDTIESIQGYREAEGLLF